MTRTRRTLAAIRNGGLIAVMTVPASGTAMAGCVEDINQTAVRLEALKPPDVPPESWFGEPSTERDVRQMLDGARHLAGDGNEEACLQMHDHAKRVLSGLESRREEAPRRRELNEIDRQLGRDAPPGRR